MERQNAEGTSFRVATDVPKCDACGDLMVMPGPCYRCQQQERLREDAPEPPKIKPPVPMTGAWFFIRMIYLIGTFGYGALLGEQLFLYGLVLAMWTVAAIYALLGIWFSKVAGEVAINFFGGFLLFSALTTWFITHNVWWTLAVPIPMTALAMLLVWVGKAKPEASTR